jgi:peptidyl-prolyl cis-trans isomerase B (cyclophilin B)
MIMKKTTLVLIALALFLIGCAQQAEQPKEEIDMDKRMVTMETTKGTIKMEIYAKEAPITSNNFIGLVEMGFYDKITFHRYEPNFVIQGGDPDGDGVGGSEKTIPLEINPKLTHVKGAVAMARTSDPNSASSQFYITLADAHFLDGNYAVFGKVTEGMDVALKLRAGDRMTKVTVQ